jgi:hypothetical protein
MMLYAVIFLSGAMTGATIGALILSALMAGKAADKQQQQREGNGITWHPPS